MNRITNSLVTLGLVMVITYGYIANIIYLVTRSTEALGMSIGRAIGIFVAPLGVILGFV